MNKGTVARVFSVFLLNKNLIRIMLRKLLRKIKKGVLVMVSSAFFLSERTRRIMRAKQI